MTYLHLIIHSLPIQDILTGMTLEFANEVCKTKVLQLKETFPNSSQALLGGTHKYIFMRNNEKRNNKEILLIKRDFSSS